MVPLGGEHPIGADTLPLAELGVWRLNLLPDYLRPLETVVRSIQWHISENDG